MLEIAGRVVVTIRVVVGFAGTVVVTAVAGTVVVVAVVVVAVVVGTVVVVVVGTVVVVVVGTVVTVVVVSVVPVNTVVDDGSVHEVALLKMALLTGFCVHVVEKVGEDKELPEQLVEELQSSILTPPATQEKRVA